MLFDAEIIREKIMQKLKEHDLKNIELEMRLGIIRDIQTSNRVFLPVIHPVIFEDNRIFRFVSGIPSLEHKYYKKKAEANFDEHEQIEDKQVITGPARIRYVKNKPTECIKKIKLCTWNIYMHKWNYDLRISLSIEVEKDIKEAQKKELLKTSTFTRLRNRTTFRSGNIQYDLTTVKVNDQETFEIETELLINDELNEKSVDNFIKKSVDYFTRE